MAFRTCRNGGFRVGRMRMRMRMRIQMRVRIQNKILDVRLVILLAVFLFHNRSGRASNRSWIGANASELCGRNEVGVGLDDSDGNVNDNGNDFFCPAGNTCCRMAPTDNREAGSSWGCIASDMGARTATCCNDDGARNTGCPFGYECRRREEQKEEDGKSSLVVYDCFLPEDDSEMEGDRRPPGHDPLLQVLPRYRLCKAEANNRRLYGLPVPVVLGVSEAAGEKDSPTTTAAELAYYSNLGPIDDPTNHALSEVQMALIVVHGATRNGDDYFCSAKATIDLQDRFRKSADAANATSVLVVAPSFRLAPPTKSDTTTAAPGSHPRVDSPSFLYWDDANDGNGSWRYGADASGPVSGISSFQAMDAVVSALRSTTLFPGLRRIAVAGHSSGGQLVQRWSLLTPSEVWPPVATFPSSDKPTPATPKPVAIHAVVANPSNYVYFSPLRFLANELESNRHQHHKSLRYGNRETIESSWRLPPTERWNEDETCPGYNQWEYGLDDGGSMDVPYRQRAIARDSKSRIVERYLFERSVSYLIGELDRCDDGTNQRCQSHGLETTCADELQGRNRYERNDRYLASLEFELELDFQSLDPNGAPWLVDDARGMVVGTRNHRRIVVPDVGHDHSMMFQSEEGIEVIYSTEGTGFGKNAFRSEYGLNPSRSRKTNSDTAE